MSQLFYYIDAMPGAGKTEYFVNLAERHIRNQKKQILVYSAPTRRLLYETFRRLLNRGVHMDNVFMVTDNLSAEENVIAGPLMKHGQWLRDSPAVALNYLLGLTTEEAYASTRYKKGYAKSCKRALCGGDIVLTTHEAFMRVNLVDQTGGDFRILKRCHVLFDEARNCVMTTRSFSLGAADGRALANSITVEERESHKEWVVSEITRMSDTKELKANFKVDTLSRVPSLVRELKFIYDSYARNGRARVYTLAKKQISFTDFMSDKTSFSLHMVLRPISLFEHYGRVTLISAFLTDSQMFHFLQKDGHQFVNLLEGPIAKDSLLYSIRARNEQLRNKIAVRLQVAPLLESKSDIRGTLTSYLLQSKFVVPSDFDVPPDKRDEAFKYIPKAYRVPPLWVLLRETVRVFKSWQAENDHADYALLTLNTGNSKRQWLSTVRYLSVVRSFLRHGYLYENNQSADEADAEQYLSDAEKQDRRFTSEAWQKFFCRYMYVKSDDRVFTTPMSPSLYGVNTYSGYHAFTHLAALNPTPDLIRFYNILLKGYDVDLDHSIDNLVQMLYRTNLRDPLGEKPVLLIVSYAAVAAMLADKLGIDKFTQVHTPRLKSWSHATEDTIQKHRAGSARGGHRNLKYAPEYHKEIRRLREYIRRAKRRLETGPPSITVSHKLATWTADLERVLKVACVKT